MRYIGGKKLLLNDIFKVIDENCKDVETVIDIFSGSGVVSKFFKEKGYNVVSNDFLYFSYVLVRGTVGVKSKPKFEGLDNRNVIDYLNNLTLKESGYSLDDCYIYQNYSPNSSCNRMYFQNKNAIKIDIIRLKIEEWLQQKKITEDEYFYLLAILLNAVSYVANIAGVFGAYLKFWDKRTYKDLHLEELDIIESPQKIKCMNCDYKEALVEDADLLYADPPYNSREYLPNYHILETIARYDRPDIHGVTGLRCYDKQKSSFCKKSTVYDSFDYLIKECKSKYIIISYNNEGLISTEELSQLCKKYSVKDSFKLIEIDYRRYKNKIPNNTAGLKEQLYFLRRY